MLKKILIVSMLLVGSLNADILQALQDAAAKAMEAQNSLNNSAGERFEEPFNKDSKSAASDQPITRHFNSLTEEAAFNKQQEQLAQQEQKFKIQKDEQEFKEKIIPRVQNLEAFNAQFYEKYLVKYTDTPEMIDNKYKNKDQLFREMQKDFKASNIESDSLLEYINTNENLLDLFNSQNLKFPSALLYSNSGNTIPTIYLEKYIDNGYINELGYDFITRCADCYEKYLKYAYSTYEDRQRLAKVQEDEKNRLAKEQKEMELRQALWVKEQKIKQEQLQLQQQKEQKERQKVQGACQSWRTKANRMVYSLGVGDKVVSKNGAVYIIQGANANTFLVNALGFNTYLQKSESIPYDALRTAPSPYCYK
jgi:hypothetical protein